MMNLEAPLNKQSTLIHKLLIWGFIVVSLIGFLDATYLTTKHYLRTPINCSVFNGCEEVTTSKYSTVAGIPVALLGAIYYLTIFILGIAYVDTKKEALAYFAARLTLIGFIVSLWLVYLQFFVLHALCLYCLVSAVTSTTLFVLGFFVLRLKNKTT